MSINCDLRHAFLCTVNFVTEFSPAKINVFLAITGRRADGFHDLVSVAAPLDFGDELVAVGREPPAAGGEPFTLACNDPTVPLDGTNLVLQAAQAFRGATGWTDGVDFKLSKRIPLGAGLGGGSSNAVATLRALNRLSGGRLAEPLLAGLAAGLGSDCPLFLSEAPVIMRGRGEQIEGLPAAAAPRLRGRRVLLFKPSFGISTPWAYGRMVARGSDYIPALAAEAKLAAWIGSGAPAEELLLNNMEGAAFEKFLALPVLLQTLRRDFGLTARMSGSGSACWALLSEAAATAPMIACIRECWGPPTWVQEARIV